jgi:hypothetical protein
LSHRVILTGGPAPSEIFYQAYRAPKP